MQPFLVASCECNLFWLHLGVVNEMLEIQAEYLIGDATSAQSCLLVNKAGVEDATRIFIAGAKVKVAVSGEYFMYEMMHKIGQSPFFSSSFRCGDVLAVGY